MAASAPALQVAPGSVARSHVVALGRDLVVDGEALSDVAVVSGSLRVGGRIAGDAIVLGGGARLTSGARVEGDLYVLGGEIVTEPGAFLGGRTVSYPSISQAWLTLMEGPSLGLPASSALVIGAKLALLSGWLVLSLMLLATTGRQLLSTSESVVTEPFRNFLVGLTAIFTLVLTALFCTSFATSLLGVPLLFLVVLLALLLKLWGMVAVFHAVGVWLGRRLARGVPLPLSAATLGLALLGVTKLLPWVGVWVWTVATLIGVGATLSTKFGRREPWFQEA